MGVNIIIVEDDQSTLTNMSAFLSTTPGFCVVGAYSNAEAALQDDKFGGCHVLLTDIELPGISGIELIKKIKPLYTSIRPIVLTIFEDDNNVFNALKAGAVGYLVKGARPTKLLDAIDEVMEGGSPMTGSIARKVVDVFRKTETLYSEKLTDRENAILSLLSDGLRYKEIAERMEISTETVRTHVRNIYNKLEVQSRTEAINKLRSSH